MGALLVVQSWGRWNFWLHLLLLPTCEGKIDNHVVCGVKEVKTDVVQV
jgi:hypothetical protein